MLNRSTTPSPYAAVFIDFENVYYFLKNHFADPPDLHDYVLDLVRKLRETLLEKELDCLVINAYADFERLATAPQGALYLLGVSTRNVLGTEHKNAADMQLCIDALEVHYTRPDIGTFVLVAGDRDYIPVLQHLRRQARQVLVAGFREAVSGDLLQNIGADHFLDARSLLSAESMERLESRRAERQRAAEESRRLRENGLPVPSAAAQAAAATLSAQALAAPPAEATTGAGTEASADKPTPATPPATPPRPAAQLPEEVPVFLPIRRVTREVERRCLAFILGELQKYSLNQSRTIRELWVGPFLRRLTDELPELPDYQRRTLLNDLRDAGAIRIEKRDGEPHPFSVIVVNYQHPDVWELNPGDNE